MCPNCLLNFGAGAGSEPPGEPTIHEPTIELEAPETPHGPAHEQTGTRIGRYKLLEPIGEGGFGTVWMAEQEEPVRRRVALKIIKLGMDTKEVVARFEAERQALAMMDHPNIARVFDGGATENGRPYFVMELVRGVRITDYCDANRLNTEQRLKLFMDVCEAVQHAHQKGIIHRDLKPSNVLVTVRDDKPVPKVIDFGIAKATGARLTEKTFFTGFNQIIGTPVYMSPEQAGLGSLDIDTRSDIYALGVILYELLTGRTPFANEELMKAALDEILRTIREKDPPKPSTRLSTLTQEDLLSVAKQRGSEPARLNRSVRGDLDWIVMKCLEKDRARRYESANGLAQDLERFLHRQPVSAAAPGLVYELTRFAQRNRVAIATAAAFAIVLVAGTVISTWEALEANRQRTRAEIQRNRSDALLLKMKIGRAQDWFAATNAPNGIAQLAQVLRTSPTNRVVAERLVNELSPFALRLPALDSMRHTGRVIMAHYSHDGKKIASASLDKTARIWDAATGVMIGGPLVHPKGVIGASFSMDDTKLLTQAEDRKARLWTVESGQLLLTVPNVPVGLVSDGDWDAPYLVTTSGATVTVRDLSPDFPVIATVRTGATVTRAKLSRDGKKLVTVEKETRVRLWEIPSGQALGEVVDSSTSPKPITCVSFSPDGQRLLTGSEDRTARIWNASNAAAIGKPFRHANLVAMARWSPDGTRIVTSGWGNSGQVWNLQTGEPIGQRTWHNSVVNFTQFSAQGDRFVTASFDKTARVWDANTGVPATDPLAHDTPVGYAEFSPDGQWLLTVSVDELVRVWSTHQGIITAAPLRHEREVSDARFSPDGKKILTASADGTARIWDADTAEPLIAPIVHGGNVLADAFSPDGTRIAIAGSSRTAGIYDVRTGQLTAPLLEHQGAIRSVDFSPDGKHLATASADKTAAIWNASTGEKIGTLVHPDDVRRVFYSPDGRMLLTVGWRTFAHLWNVATGKLIGEPLKHGAPNTEAFFSSDGEFVISTASENLVRLWSARTGKPIRSFDLERAGLMAVFSPDTKYIAAAADDRVLHIWNRETGQPANDGIRLIDARMHYTEFDPSGRRILVVATNRFRIFDVQSGLAVSETFEHQGIINRARFSPDGRRVVTSSSDGTARIWEVPPATSPVPDWLPELAEMLARQRFDEDGKMEVVPSAELARLKRRMLTSAADDYYGRWARWFFAANSERTISPFSPIRVSNFLPPGSNGTP